MFGVQRTPQNVAHSVVKSSIYLLAKVVVSSYLDFDNLVIYCQILRLRFKVYMVNNVIILLLYRTFDYKYKSNSDYYE